MMSHGFPFTTGRVRSFLRRLSRVMLAVVAAIGLGSSVRAEDLSRLFPSHCVLYASLRGGDNVADLVAKTNLGQMLTDERMQRWHRMGEQIIGYSKEQLGTSADGVFRDIIGSIGRHDWAVGITKLDLHLGQTAGDPIVPEIEARVIVASGEASSALSTTIHNLVKGAAHLTTRESAVLDVPLQEVVGVPLYYGVVDGYFIAALGVGVAEDIIGRLRATDGKSQSFSDSGDYSLGVKRILLGAPPLAALYVDVPTLIAQLRKTSSIWLGVRDGERLLRLLDAIHIDQYGGITIASGIGAGGYKTGAYLPVAGPSPELPLISEADLDLIPRDTLGFIALNCDLADHFQRALDVAYAVEPAIRVPLQRQLMMAQGLLGTSIDDALRAFGHKLFVFEEPAMRSLVPALVVAIEPADAERVEATLKVLTTLLSIGMATQNSQLGLRQLEVGRSTISFLHFDGDAAWMPIAPAWVRSDRFVFFALQPSHLEEYLATRGTKTIIENPDFRRSAALIPGSATAIAYANDQLLVSYLYPMMIPLVQAGLGALRGFAIRDLDFDAAAIPSSTFVTSHLFGEALALERDDSGWLVAGHGPLPVPLSLISAGVALGVVAVPFLFARAERVRAVQLASPAAVARPLSPTVATLAPSLATAQPLIDAYTAKHGGNTPSRFSSLLLFQRTFPHQAYAQRYTLIGGPTVQGQNRIVAYQSQPTASGRREVLWSNGQLQRISDADLTKQLAAQAPKPKSPKK